MLIGYHWLDAPSFKEKRNQLTGTGYMPEMLFNKVLDQALTEAGLTRSDIYITQAFHLLPSTRSHKIPKDHLLRSFLEITRHELVDRQVIALGSSVASLCARCQIHCQKVAHPSARGRTDSDKAHELAEALKRAAASAE